MEINSSHEPPRISQDAVLVKSVDIPPETQTVRGYSFDEGIDYHELLSSFTRSGFQATHFGRAVDEVKAMLKKRSEPMGEVSPHVDEELKPKTNCTIFLAYTSNMTSSGMREVIRFLVKNKMVDCLVTTGGGIEEDFIKCMAPTYIGDFKLKGSELRSKGLNRIGNLIAPNNNYCLFEDWLMPVLDQMLVEQQREDVNWTPSKMIHRLGKEINHQDSIYYWAYKNNIPVFSPAITDGAIGDNIYFHSYKNPGLRIDIAEDELIIEIWEPCGDEHQSLPSLDTDPMRVTGSLIPYFHIPCADVENLKNVNYIKKINNLAVYARNTGMIILGGGLIKHHTCNANLMRNGADYSVYINTAHEFDGSDAGASPDEAVSWGKIKTTATPVKVVGDATILFPLLVAETFARDFHSSKVKRTVDDCLEE